MGQVAVAAIGGIAGGATAASLAALRYWVLPWIISRVQRQSQVTLEVPKKVNRAIPPSAGNVFTQELQSTPLSELVPKSNPYRRIGIAERRRMAEMQSLAGPTHQAEVTANNARAMQ